MEGIRGFFAGGERGAIRALGGIVLGVALLVILERRTATLDPWGSLPIFLALLAPTAFLLGTGFLGGRATGGNPNGWQVVYTVFGLILLPLTLIAFLNWVGGDPNSSWNTAWIFALVAVAGFASAFYAGVRIGCLFGGLALIVVWLALWDEILSGGLTDDFGTTRDSWWWPPRSWSRWRAPCRFAGGSAACPTSSPPPVSPRSRPER